MSAWTWDDHAGPARLRDALALRGYAVVRIHDVAREAAAGPWAFAQRLFREPLRMVERQPIRVASGGRSFASTDVFTPLHTDSQLYLGAPPAAQVMACARPAAQGGDTHLVDAWSLCAAIERDDPPLFDALLRVPRRMPFVFGDVYGPTLALRGGALAFTHSPIDTPQDRVSARLAPHLARAPRVTLRVEADEALVVDNLRMLHGRSAFRDAGREFVRLLVWRAVPCGDHPRYRSLCASIGEASRRALAGAPLRVTARFGVYEGRDDEAARRLRVVLEMLRGVPPGVLAARAAVPEEELYAWRDAALVGALDAVERVDRDAETKALDAALAARRARE